MSYLPDDEDGISFNSFGAGSQLNIPGTAGNSSGALRTITITNNENFTLMAEVSFVCRLRTELVNGGRRTDFEGYFYAESTTGATILGVERHYAEAHMSGTNNVVSNLWGHSAGEGLLVTGNVIPTIAVAPGETEDVRVRWAAGADTQNVRLSVGTGGYVQCLGGLVKLFQLRNPALDRTVVVT